MRPEGEWGEELGGKEGGKLQMECSKRIKKRNKSQVFLEALRLEKIPYLWKITKHSISIHVAIN